MPLRVINLTRLTIVDYRDRDEILINVIYQDSKSKVVLSEESDSTSQYVK